MWDRHSAERSAVIAGQAIRRKAVDVQGDPVGLILGTGWGDALQLGDPTTVPFHEIPGFGDLAEIGGHKRQVVIGDLGDRTVFALSGRVHLNEHPYDPAVPRMVRLQTEMLIQAGVKTLIVTCAAGSLDSKRLPARHVCVTDGFVTGYAPPMPLFAGEFCNPEDTLDETLVARAVYGSHTERDSGGRRVHQGGHVMVRGPFFEGRRYDKPLLARTGALTVGMSTLPEACIAALYGVKVLALAYVSNDEVEEHSHEENLRRAKEDQAFLATFLERQVRHLPKD